ncbi:Arylsulfatase A [Neorhodopirellula lusitana]|uniref:Arylsulfatase A n=1 Tax=Neorhodopirellula lusitana TaxID=445327 RepID=A0ABY1PRF3_9BACT|nr:sulfatase-like hydrolase/transferase [Neorhodopirellula lusitana]SMP43770.1 Arylsulfatase A [Neorhodopirellula lusitana]
MRFLSYSLSVIAFVSCSGLAADAADRPNVILIVSDDQGYSDVGFNGCCEIPTPRLDALAASGVAFDAGYASHPYCSPSRAGLLTGRYQQRFGHECNPGIVDSDEPAGLPLDQTLMSDLFHENGYRTAAIGKWHLGDEELFWPTNRGFDEWFGFSGGGYSYWGTPKPGMPYAGVLRDGKPVPVEELSHLTDDFSTEAVRFIEDNQDSPFFLYLAYNAPHAPDHATREHLAMVEHIEYGGRAVYGAMVAGMDAGIGRVHDKLKELEIDDNTLIFFFSDNGGRVSHARNLPLRGHKGMLFEGGVRVPFCVSWPGHVPAGKRYRQPVSSLDIMPTVLAAAGIQAKPELELDGVDLLPFLSGTNRSTPHERLFWRYAMGDGEYGFAVREGNLKLVQSAYKNRTLLFDLSEDVGERVDLAQQQPETVERLSLLIRDWDAGNIKPIWLDPHGANVHKEEAAREKAINAASRGQKDR